QAVARLVSLTLAVATTFLLTRHLGVSGYGVYVTVTVYVPFFVVFFDAGMTLYVVRSLSIDQTRGDVFREALGLRIALALPMTLVAFGVAVAIYGGVTLNAIAIALPLILFMTVASATTALFQARL